LIFENRAGYLKRAKNRRTRLKSNAFMALRAPPTTGARRRTRRALNGELRREKAKLRIENGEGRMVNDEW
jgi:hypothetical protein